MSPFYLVTGNLNKVYEAELALGFKPDHVNLDLDEIQEMDEKLIAEHKARQAWDVVKKPIVIWDTSLYIHCFNNFPGPLIKWFWQTVTLEKICQIVQTLGDDKITTQLLLTYFDGKRLEHFSGESFGRIPSKPQGDGGFGWDAIFIPEGSTLTYSQMQESDPYYHTFNKEAFLKLQEFLNNNA